MAQNTNGNANEDIVIDVKDVSMEFNMSNFKVDSLKEYFVRLVKHELFFTPFYALKGVSFSVKRGEVLGLIGFNGGGKSTMLKIIAGVMKPTTGSVEVRGTLSPMIELGAGFDPDLTARENIFLNGSILGYSKQFKESVFDEVLAVGDYKFQEKCKNRIRELMANNTTVILVSHDSKQIEEMCTRAIWLDHGLIVEDGETAVVCEHYKKA